MIRTSLCVAHDHVMASAFFLWLSEASSFLYSQLATRGTGEEGLKFRASVGGSLSRMVDWGFGS